MKGFEQKNGELAALIYLGKSESPDMCCLIKPKNNFSLLENLKYLGQSVSNIFLNKIKWKKYKKDININKMIKI